jgi:hypothetical protein
MQLELSEEERDALRQALDSVLAELSSEIANTDNASYRRGLAAHRDQLRSVSERLAR